MQVFHRGEHAGTGLLETIGMPDQRERATYQRDSQSDTGITYLYRSGQNAEIRPSFVPPVDSQNNVSAPARRYDETHYLRVDWQSLAASPDGQHSPAPVTASRGLANVYARVLERAERRLGADTVASLLLLIHASRNGLSSSELAAISGCSAEQVAALTTELQNHIMPKGGRISLPNLHIASAIEVRYGGIAGEGIRGTRRSIAAYFEAQELTARVAEELPWQLLELGDLDRLQSCVTAAGIASALCETGRRGDLCIYWNALQGRVNLVQSYGSSLEGVGEAGKIELFALLARYYSLATGDTNGDLAEVATRTAMSNAARNAGMMYAG